MNNARVTIAHANPSNFERQFETSPVLQRAGMAFAGSSSNSNIVFVNLTVQLKAAKMVTLMKKKGNV
jgi:hypothetical protein